MSTCNIGNTKEDKEFAKAWSELSKEEKYDLVTSVPATAVRLLNNTKPTIGGEKVEVLEIQPNGDSFSIKYKVGRKERSVSTEGAPFDNPVSTSKVQSLYSDLEMLKQLRTNPDEVVLDLVNNPDEMMRLGNELADASDVGISPTHRNELLSRLSMFKDEFKEYMPKINVHINKKAAKNGGIAELSTEFTGDIYIGTGPGKSFKNPLEVYVHELYHAATFYALESRDPKIAKAVRSIQNIKNEFLANTTAEKLSHAMGRGKGSVKEGQKILDYLADESVGLHEFVAYAMTNEAVMKVLKDTTSKDKKVEGNLIVRLVAAVQAVFKGILDKVSKTPTDNDLSRMMWFTNTLVKANNRALENRRDGLMMRIVGEYGNTQERLKKYVAESEIAKKLTTKTPRRKGTGAIDTALYYAKLGGSAFFNENSKRALETSISLQGWSFLKPEATLQTVVRDASESDEYQDLIENMGLESTIIDQHRENIAIHTTSSILNGFDEQLTEEYDVALTSTLLDTDAVSLYYDYDMLDLVSDNRNIDKEYSKLDAELKKQAESEEDYNYYVAQIKGLGYYLHTHKATSVQLLNANNIAMQLGTKYEKEEADPKLVSLIDKMASLEALKMVSGEEKALVKELLEKDRNGVDTLMAYVNGHKEHAEKTLFSAPGDKFKITKGYTKEVFSRDVEGQVAPLADEAEMKKKGFKLYKPLTNHKAHKNVPMGYYITTTSVRQNLHRVALRYTDRTSKGTTYRESYRYAEDRLVNIRAEKAIALTQKENIKLVEGLRRGEVTIGEVIEKNEDNVVPLINNAGSIKDFRYLMSKEEKIKVYKQDRRASQVMGRTFASTFDKQESKSFNKKLINEVVKDAIENLGGKKGLIGRNTKEYVVILKDSTEEEIKEMWKMLPKDIQAQFLEGMPVRRDMMHSIMGYRELSIMDAKLLERFPESIKYAVMLAEKLWKEVVRVAKIDIILRLPAVFIGNVVSNFMYSILTGSSPVTIAKLQLQAVQELNKYIKDKSRLTTLEQKEIAGKVTAEEKRIMSTLKNDIEMSSVKPLIDAGLYTTILEELELGVDNNASMFTDILDEKMKGVPEVVRNGVNWLYLNEKTAFYKFMNTATQYSDFVARYAQFHILQKRGVGKEEALKTVRDAFINYNKPNSRFVEWANQMGFIMFTKYFTRIQKAIKHLFRGHPISAIMILLLQDALIGDVSDITDQSILIKDVGNSFYNPIDTFMRAITPSGAEAVIYGMNKAI